MPRVTWDLPGPENESLYLALAGGFLPLDHQGSSGHPTFQDQKTSLGWCPGGSQGNIKFKLRWHFSTWRRGLGNALDQMPRGHGKAQDSSPKQTQGQSGWTLTHPSKRKAEPSAPPRSALPSRDQECDGARRDALPFTEWDAATHSLGCPEIPPRGKSGQAGPRSLTQRWAVGQGAHARQTSLPMYLPLPGRTPWGKIAIASPLPGCPVLVPRQFL